MRVICFGAHPDDCEITFGGTAAKFAAAGTAVKFVAVANGDAGHHRQRGETLAARRRAEAEKAAEALGIAATEVLCRLDGRFLADLELRHQVIRLIREWKADVVLTHRPNDYHPDHRQTSLAVQDSAYLVVVPNLCPEAEPLRTNPAYFYLEDQFRKPAPFSPDITVEIDSTWQTKLDALEAHESQFYEWLPWVAGTLEEVPAQPRERREWLSRNWSRPPLTSALIARYGEEHARSVCHTESFELCEYGRQPSAEELDRMFPR